MKMEYEESVSPCWNLRNTVIVIGCISILIHVLEFFAFWYLLAAFYIIKETPPESGDQFWTLLYPALLILHAVIQAACSVVLLIGIVKKRKTYLLPWIVCGAVECAFLLKSAIILGINSNSRSAWIVTTTFVFFIVQFFYVICVILYYRKLKKTDREVQPSLQEKYHI